MSNDNTSDNNSESNSDKSGETRDTNVAFEKRARDLLRAAEQDVSPEVNQRLGEMRRAAVQELEDRSNRRQTSGIWLPAGASAVVVLALGIFLYPGNEIVPMIDNLDETQLAAAQDMELLGELEFIAWLEEEESNAG